MSPYASGTIVAWERSRDAIEKLVRKHGGGSFGYGSVGNRHQLSFSIALPRPASAPKDKPRELRFVRLEVTIPPIESFQWTPGPRPKRRHPGAMQDARDAEERRLWRATLLLLKAKFEGAAAGLTTLEREFFADTVLPDQRRVFEAARSTVAEAYSTGKLPAGGGVLALEATAGVST